jgi:hypothetical protein
MRIANGGAVSIGANVSGALPSLLIRRIGATGSTSGVTSTFYSDGYSDNTVIGTGNTAIYALAAGDQGNTATGHFVAIVGVGGSSSGNGLSCGGWYASGYNSDFGGGNKFGTRGYVYYTTYNTSQNYVGGYFSTELGYTAFPTLAENAALMCDNTDTSAYSFVAKAGGANKLVVNSTGLVGINTGTGTPSSKLDVTATSVGTTTSGTNGISLVNTTAAANGAQQNSPSLRFNGKGWGTTASTSQACDWIIYNTPIQGAVPTVSLIMASSVAGAAYTSRFTLTSGGTLTIGGGLTIAGSITGATSCSFSSTLSAATSFTCPIHYGGSTTTSTLSLVATSGVGTTGADIIFKVGNAGGTEAARILNSGFFGIGTSPSTALHVVKTTEQLRIGYDGSNYASWTSNSTGSVTLALTGTSPTWTFSQQATFSAGIIGSVTNGGYQSNTTFSNSHFAVTSTNAGTSQSAASLQIGGFNARLRTMMRGSTSLTPAAGENAFGLIVGTQDITNAGSGTHALFSQVAIKAPTISGSGAAITKAVTLYVDDAPTGATTNIAFEVAAGKSKFGGVIGLKAYTVATLPAGVTGDMAYVTDLTSPTYNGTLTGGGSVVRPVFYNGSSWVS